MSTEKILFCTFPLLLLVVALLAWSWIDPPKAAPYGTYNPDTRVNVIEFKPDAPSGVSVAEPTPDK